MSLSHSYADLEEARRPFVRKLLRWGRQHRRPFPWRVERDPFQILVAEVLLQRSRGVTVAKVYSHLFGLWPDAKALAAADLEAIRAVIRPLGLTRRAELIKRLAEQVVEMGKVPNSVEDMLRLSGVGRYAASATLSVAFGQRQPTVDGTSARVYRRFFGLRAKRDSQVDEELWELAEAAMPQVATKEWNWAVLDLAALVCLPKSPRCTECPLREDCVVGRSRGLVSDAGVP